MNKRTRMIALASLAAAMIGDLSVNVATQTLPAAWSPFLWIAWPILGLSFLVVAVVELTQRRRDAVIAASGQQGRTQPESPSTPSTQSQETKDGYDQRVHGGVGVQGPNARVTIVNNGQHGIASQSAQSGEV